MSNNNTNVIRVIVTTSPERGVRVQGTLYFGSTSDAPSAVDREAPFELSATSSLIGGILSTANPNADVKVEIEVGSDASSMRRSLAVQGSSVIFIDSPSRIAPRFAHAGQLLANSPCVQL